MELKKIIELIDGVPTYSFVKKTLRAIGHSFKLYEYILPSYMETYALRSLKDLYICFNGGKDAEVVLHLVRLALYK